MCTHAQTHIHTDIQVIHVKIKFIMLTDPCLTGNCTNIVGLFECACPPANTGHRCQYMISCNSTSCAGGETCVETVATVRGFICVPMNSEQRLTIELNEGVSDNQLDEALFDLVRYFIYLKCNDDFISFSCHTD